MFLNHPASHKLYRSKKTMNETDKN